LNKASDDNASHIQQLENYKAALIAWDHGHDTLTDGTSIRTFINRNAPAVRKLVLRAGCSKTMTVSPPPAVGGLIMRNVDPFGCVFEGPYGMNMTSVICDMIDETVASLKLANSEQNQSLKQVRKR